MVYHLLLHHTLCSIEISLYSTALYGEMKEGLLAEETEFASKGLRDQLKRRSILLSVLQLEY